MRIRKDEAVEILIKNRQGTPGQTRRDTFPKTRQRKERAARRRIQSGWRFFDAMYLRNPSTGAFETPPDFIQQGTISATETPCQTQVTYPPGRNPSALAAHIRDVIYASGAAIFNRARQILPTDAVQIFVVSNADSNEYPITDYAEWSGNGWRFNPSQIADINSFRVLVQRPRSDSNSIVNKFYIGAVGLSGNSKPDGSGDIINLDLTKPLDVVIIPAETELLADRSDTVQTGTEPNITITWTRQEYFPFAGGFLRDTCYNSESPIYGANFQRVWAAMPNVKIYKTVSYLELPSENGGCLSSGIGGDTTLAGFDIGGSTYLNATFMARQSNRLIYK